jgi:hypothetical protein
VLTDSVLVLQTRELTVALCDDREAQVGHHRAAMDALPSGGPDHVAAQESITGTEPLDALTAIVLLSDGASRLVDHVDLSTWPELVRLARTAGPAAIIDQVCAAERGDPAGRRWPRGKSSDDATAAYAVGRVPGDA